VVLLQRNIAILNAGLGNAPWRGKYDQARGQDTRRGQRRQDTMVTGAANG
jgi:hypothetical protein